MTENDANCVTMPDGSCVSDKPCLHGDSTVPAMTCRACDGKGCVYCDGRGYHVMLDELREALAQEIARRG